MKMTSLKKDNLKNNHNSKKLNNLNGKEWLRYSISVWDIFKTPEERKLNHPAMFPLELCERLIKIFTKEDDIVFDPFFGSGSTLIAAKKHKRKAIGFEINKDYVELFKDRIKQTNLLNFDTQKQEKLIKIHQKNANLISEKLDKNSIDLCLTSPHIGIS